MANLRIQPPGEGSVRRLPLDLSLWTLHNFAAGQSLTKVGDVFRWTTDGSNNTDTSFVGGIGAMAVLKASIDDDLQVFASPRWAAWLKGTTPTAVDVGFGYGIVSSDADAPAEFVTRMHFRDAVDQTRRDSGNVADVTRTTGAVPRIGRFFEQRGVVARGVACYNPGNPTPDNASAVNAANIAAPFSNQAGGTSLFFALFFKGGANAGSVDIGPIRHDIQRTSPL